MLLEVKHLEEEIEKLKNMNEEKEKQLENSSEEREINNEEMIAIKQKNKDLNDEVQIKCEEIESLRRTIEITQVSSLKDSASSLSEELSAVDIHETKVKELEYKLKKNEMNQVKRMVLMKQMEELSNDRNKELEVLKVSIES